MKATLIYKTHFNAAYRLYNPFWEVEKNKKIFGNSTPESAAFHGHNYDLEIHLHGEVEIDTGNVIDKKILASLVKEHIEKRYDHRNLYEDVADFKDTVPTAEMIAFQVWKILRPLIAQNISIKVIIQESSQIGGSFEG
ncbi:MAG: 6-carboxytetrahydropterin synthase [Flammeovirgaceae bacterium]